jgi:hypothetical protein
MPAASTSSSPLSSAPPSPIMPTTTRSSAEHNRTQSSAAVTPGGQRAVSAGVVGGGEVRASGSQSPEVSEVQSASQPLPGAGGESGLSPGTPLSVKKAKKVFQPTTARLSPCLTCAHSAMASGDGVRGCFNTEKSPKCAHCATHGRPCFPV